MMTIPVTMTHKYCYIISVNKGKSALLVFMDISPAFDAVGD